MFQQLQFQHLDHESGARKFLNIVKSGDLSLHQRAEEQNLNGER